MSAADPGVRRVSVTALAEYPDRVDVRSPAEYAHDHAVGAANHPVLDDAERAKIGTLYARSPFEARKLGAAIVARNIATMFETAFMARSREWRPLVYCWRGGQRSRALTQVLLEVGWRAAQLEGGYRAYRRHVVAELLRLPALFEFVVICGLTGSGKSRLLQALADEGAQTLDLEAIARHRGSLLGEFPGAPQPSQKWFESQLVHTLSKLDPARPVYVESESRRIGALQMPEALVARMRDGRRVSVVASLAQRVTLLKEDYAHYFADPQSLTERLDALTALRGKTTVARWKAMASASDWDGLVAELLETHYDPTYRRALERNFPAADAARIEVHGISRTALRTLARELRSLTEAGAVVAD